LDLGELNEIPTYNLPQAFRGAVTKCAFLWTLGVDGLRGIEAY
jgi:hypothetical protein